MGLKISGNLGPADQNSKSPFLGDFPKIMQKVLFFAGIIFENIESFQNEFFAGILKFDNIEQTNQTKQLTKSK